MQAGPGHCRRLHPRTCRRLSPGPLSPVPPPPPPPPHIFRAPKRAEFPGLFGASPPSRVRQATSHKWTRKRNMNRLPPGRFDAARGAIRCREAHTRMSKQVEQLDHVVIRIAGDSGDGMQLTGDRFTQETAVFGNDLSTLPNFPAEIRAPQGTLAGVSSFQLHFADHDILTPGDAPDVLVAMN